ncbi:ferredoxin [Mycobacterium florentinum]|uniref:ferredoxin n=1 Tax=Mycobacterium florentinum TaxID=292462 RepID=UPI0021F36019|nr:ferredoxin [Mycobacterium florentinum]
MRSETCMASGYCIRHAPKVFSADESGWVTLLDAEPRGQTVQVLKAAGMCPVAAIDVFDADGNQL